MEIVLYDKQEETVVKLHSLEELKMLAFSCQPDASNHFTDFNNPEQVKEVLEAAGYELQPCEGLSVEDPKEQLGISEKQLWELHSILAALTFGFAKYDQDASDLGWHVISPSEIDKLDNFLMSGRESVKLYDKYEKNKADIK